MPKKCDATVKYTHMILWECKAGGNSFGRHLAIFEARPRNHYISNDRTRGSPSLLPNPLDHRRNDTRKFSYAR